MATKNNEVLGYSKCDDCGDRATVHKVKRGKGRYLYKRCGCGCDQRTGAKVQTKLFYGTEWIGDAPEPPPNIIKPKVVDEPKQTKEEPNKEPETTGKKPLLLALAAGTGFMLLALMGKKA